MIIDENQVIIKKVFFSAFGQQHTRYFECKSDIELEKIIKDICGTSRIHNITTFVGEKTEELEVNKFYQPEKDIND